PVGTSASVQFTNDVVHQLGETSARNKVCGEFTARRSSTNENGPLERPGWELGSMKSLSRVRKRWKRCYELAWRVMIEEPGSERVRLVHGWAPQGRPGGNMLWYVLPMGP